MTSALESFRRDVLRGLSAPVKHVPSKYLWDAAGCALFERICELPEYYPTRTELAILARSGAELARLAGPECRVLEFGSGSGKKSRLLLDALARPRAYLPVDIADEALAMTAKSLAGLRERLAIVPIRADFTGDFAIPETPGTRTLGFFPGSTIGNQRPAEAAAFLARAARMLGEAGALVVGVDLRKDPRRLVAAYADSQGVTAAFNRNLLLRLNRELGADFDLGAFEHVVHYDPDTGRLEMRLVSTRAQQVRIAERTFAFAKGEYIHTEDCWKYAIADFHTLARRAGFDARATWVDDEELFSVHFLEVR